MSSNFLFVQPSFLRGMARVVDLGGTLNRRAYNSSKTAIEADSKAILSDWQVLADDIREAFDATTNVVKTARSTSEG